MFPLYVTLFIKTKFELSATICNRVTQMLVENAMTAAHTLSLESSCNFGQTCFQHQVHIYRLYIDAAFILDCTI